MRNGSSDGLQVALYVVFAFGMASLLATVLMGLLA